MRAKALEIRWHETNPIFSADFHHLPPLKHKKPTHPYAKLSNETRTDADIERDRLDREKQWRLATCGGDNNVRLWLVTPRPPPTVAPLALPSTITTSGKSSKPSASASKPFTPNEAPDPKVEYLATLSQHTGVVNCVRFCPQGECLASAGDDGNILLWVPGEGSKKIGETDEDRAYERESWRVKSMIRSLSGKEIYDLAWSPSGQQILAGSVDHTATIYDVASGQALHRIAEHTNYVQGVAWDPKNQFIATQSSDRSMHVYSIAATNNNSALSVHAVGKNSRMELKRRASASSHASAGPRPSSKPRGRPSERDARAGDDVFLPPPRVPNRARSTSRASDSDRSETSSTSTATRLPETETAMEPPASIPSHSGSSGRPGHSRRSSSSTVTSHSPALNPVSSRPLRSPSPAPLPAVMLDTTSTPTNSNATSSSALETIKLYSDANSTPFFRRLSWSTDGSLLLTPAGMFEDPFCLPVAAAAAGPTNSSTLTSSSANKKGKRKEDNVTAAAPAPAGPGESKPTVYIYTRSNVSKPPVANLMGHRTTSIAIRFCPILWQLRNNMTSTSTIGSAAGTGEDGDEPQKIDLTDEGIDVPLPGSSTTATTTVEKDGRPSKSLFDLPYRMVYAVATLDSVYLYDTQQEGPICMFGNLHYAPFTDLTWAPDGQTLILSSQDGYCSIVAFSPGELGVPYTGDALEPNSDVPLASAPVLTAGERKLEDMFAHPKSSDSTTPNPTSSSTTVSMESQPQPTVSTTPAGPGLDVTVPEKRPASPTTATGGTLQDPHQPLVKKKKKVALTHVGPLGSNTGGGGSTAGPKE
ncbi:Cac2p [Sporobolomyces koalae]|uniref:Cac2p n=1 Tax=Sporobolomyces koalae TaxID=500713 RepID=UPI0031724F3F